MRHRIRLTESQLHRVIKESVKRILAEEENIEPNIWTDGNENGPFEFGAKCGYPTEETLNRGYDGRNGSSITDRVRMQGASPREYGYLMHAKNPFASDDRFIANSYANYGVTPKIINKGADYTQFQDRDYDKPDQDLQQFNDRYDRKAKGNYSRSLKAADERPLHRRGSLNREF